MSSRKPVKLSVFSKQTVVEEKLNNFKIADSKHHDQRRRESLHTYEGLRRAVHNHSEICRDYGPRRFGQNDRGGGAGAQPATVGARHLHNFSNIEVFSRDILDFWKGSKIEVAQCYLIELNALSDTIV